MHITQPDVSQTVMVSLAPPRSTAPRMAKAAPNPQQKPAKPPPATATSALENTLPLPVAPAQASDSQATPSPSINSTPAYPSTHSGSLLDLQIDATTLRNAAREVDRKSVRRLARESGQPDLIDPERPDPLKLAFAEMSEPRCPPSGLTREARGDPMGPQMKDRSGDCANNRRERVRARALAR